MAHQLSRILVIYDKDKEDFQYKSLCLQSYCLFIEFK